MAPRKSPVKPKQGSTSGKAANTKSRAAKVAEKKPPAPIANDSDSDGKQPDHSLSSGAVEEDSFIDDEAVEDNTTLSDEEVSEEDPVAHSEDNPPTTPDKRSIKRSRGVKSSPETDSATQTPSPRKKKRSATDPKDTAEFKTAKTLVQEALKSKSAKKEESAESDSGDSMIDTFVQVKQEPNVKVKHEAVVNQKPFKTVKKPVFDKSDPFLDGTGTQVARRQTPFVKTAMSDADKSKDKGKSKVVVQDSGATDEESDVEEADSVNFEKARKASLAHIASTNPGDGSTRLYGDEDMQAFKAEEEEWVITTTTDGQVFRIRKGFLLSMGQPVQDTSPSRSQIAAKPSSKPSSKVVLDDNTVYLEDVEKTSQQEPAVCQVNNPARQDSRLRYPNDLPRLYARNFQTWSSADGPGLVVFSAWAVQCPSMSMRQARHCIEFVEHNTIVNPSRVSPTRLKLNANVPRYISFSNSSAPAIMTSAIMVTESHLCTPEISFNEPQKSIKGIFHDEEFQRLESTLCMVAGWDTAHVQLHRDALTFSTKRAGQSQGGQPSPAKNPSKMFASSTRSSAPVSVEGSLLKKPALYASDKIPVLDGRGTRPAFNLGSDLDNLGAKLPEFHNEVPAGSFAWVGYSVNAFRSQKGDNFAMNLLWVVVVGTPAD